MDNDEGINQSTSGDHESIQSPVKSKLKILDRFTIEQSDLLKKVFAFLGSNGDGLINRQEFMSLLQSTTEMISDDGDIVKAISIRMFPIDFNTFFAIFVNTIPKLYHFVTIKKALIAIEGEDDGKVSACKLRQYLVGTGKSFTATEIESFFDEIGVVDKDKIDIDSLAKLLILNNLE